MCIPSLSLYNVFGRGLFLRVYLRYACIIFWSRFVYAWIIYWSRFVFACIPSLCLYNLLVEFCFCVYTFVMLV